MRSFKTKDGAEWRVSVNVGTIKRCFEETGLRLTDIFSTEQKVAEFFSDDVRFCEVVLAVIRPQLEAAGKNDTDFFESIDGAVIEAASEALLAEIVDFFQEPRKGLLKKVLAKYQEAEARVRCESTVAAESTLEKISFDTLIRQTLTNSASNSQESAA